MNSTLSFYTDIGGNAYGNARSTGYATDFDVYNPQNNPVPSPVPLFGWPLIPHGAGAARCSDSVMIGNIDGLGIPYFSGSYSEVSTHDGQIVSVGFNYDFTAAQSIFAQFEVVACNYSSGTTTSPFLTLPGNYGPARGKAIFSPALSYSSGDSIGICIYQAPGNSSVGPPPPGNAGVPGEAFIMEAVLYCLNT